ncbi:PREDICTED: coiled-coil domain-containing protein 36 [Hipposideros armiger]|uniref:Coiled-coil domain-containing protein 36 n=1 Tax=Hipposideros armiger TaxID=186990 RepID=A0A8B7QDH0_HIPAR|nr:PREDICTED: coiled-coil domain-containing protein 36 [Hipposideros armiger]
MSSFSEPSIFTKYQTKPQLFGGDTKGGGLFPLPLPAGKSKGLLEQFEEKKKRAQDKCDSEALYNFISQIRENIHKLQTSVEKSEEHFSSRSQSILDSLETVVKTLQEAAQAQSDLALETGRDKGDMEQAILEMQKKLEARQAEFLEMKSSLKHLEALVTQQSKDFQQLCDQLGQLNVPCVLAELKRLTSMPGVPRHVKDSTSQTSPPLAQSPHFSRQDKHASEEPVMGQAQALPAAQKVRMGSLRPGALGAWGEGAKSAALQEEAALLTTGGGRRNRRISDKAMQTPCKKQDVTKTGSESHGASILASQGAPRLISLDLNNFATSSKNTRQKRRAKGMFPCNTSDQNVVTEQKGTTVEKGGTKKQQQPRKARRGRPLARKQEQNPSKTRAFNSKCPQSPVSGSQRSPPEQQEPLVQPLHLHCPRSPIESACPSLGGRLTPRKRASQVQGDVLQPRGRASQNKSSHGDHQISWFSDLNLESFESPLCKKPGKSLLYDLCFDSSDDGF